MKNKLISIFTGIIFAIFSFSASAVTEIVWWDLYGGGDGENSVYTISLAKNMLLEDTSIDQVFRNVRKEVLKLSNNMQRPIEYSQLTGDIFYLNKKTEE